LKFLKMMVAEDVTTMVEVLADSVEEEVLEAEVSVQTEVLVVVLAEEVQLLEKVDLEATEFQLLEKVDLEEEAKAEVHQHQEEKVLFLEMKGLLKEHLVVLKVLVMHLDQEDQEKINFLYCKLKSQMSIIDVWDFFLVLGYLLLVISTRIGRIERIFADFKFLAL